MQRYDWYAKPVSLTYNQQKTFNTVPGSICSGISALFLIFYIASNIVKYVDPDYSVFFSSSSNNLINLNSPPSYEILINEFNILTTLRSTNETITDLDAYYGGLYI
jgi:hypothetical protein